MTLEQLLMEDYDCSHPVLDEPVKKRKGDETRYLSRHGERCYSRLVKTLYDLSTVVPEAFPIEQVHEAVAALNLVAAGNDMSALSIPKNRKEKILAEKEGAKR